MLRALPKSQQARWLEIGRAFERVRRPARLGEHVAFTPVAEAGGAGRIPTRFARTARIPSALRPIPADAMLSSLEVSEPPTPPVSAEASPTTTASSGEIETAAITRAAAEPETTSPPTESIATATPEPPPAAETAPAARAPEPVEAFPGQLPSQHQPATVADWGGWTSYAARKDYFPHDEAAAGGHVAEPPAAAAAPATTPPAPPSNVGEPPTPVPPPAPAPGERRGTSEEPRVSAIEYFRAAPW